MGLIDKILGRDVTTDVIELLTSQHDEVDALIAKLEAGGGDRRALFNELADKLAAHAAVEEKIFYPAVMSKDTSDQLHESVEEHLAIKRLLADMLGMRLDDESFMAKLSVLKEQVSHHAHTEEEDELFPKVKRMFNRDERAALGNEVLALFEELMTQSPRTHVPAELDAAAPLPDARR